MTMVRDVSGMSPIRQTVGCMMTQTSEHARCAVAAEVELHQRRVSMGLRRATILMV